MPEERLLCCAASIRPCRWRPSILPHLSLSKTTPKLSSCLVSKLWLPAIRHYWSSHIKVVPLFSIIMARARYEGYCPLLPKICIYIPVYSLRHTYTPLRTSSVKLEEFDPVFSDRRGKPSSELLLQVCSSTVLCHEFILYYLEFWGIDFWDFFLFVWFLKFY